MPTRKTRNRWYRDEQVGGLAMIHGKASSGIACRDYDDPTAYERWTADHPQLAAILPTSISHRGPKVYFLTNTEIYRLLPNGELIGNSKHYSCIPPTIHPATGQPYTWLVQFVAMPPMLDPVEAGFIIPAELERIQPVELERFSHPKSICKVESGHSNKEVQGGGGFFGGVEGERDELERAIQNSIPSGRAAQ
jgi:hypothetical protein